MRLGRPALAFLVQLWRNERGNFAIILGLCAIPLLGIIGLGIDVTRAYVAQIRLQGACDNAALAAAGMRGEPDDVIIKVATQYFYSNYREDFWAPPAAPVVRILEGSVRVEATAKSHNYFLHLFGDRFDDFDIATVAEATGQARGLELVLVLDITSSMNLANAGQGTQKKIDALKEAAADLVEILFGDNDTHNLLKIGIVPFAASVRLDPDMAVSEGWIDTEGAAKYARSNFDASLPNNYAYALFTQYLASSPWKGCVEARPDGLEESDTPPAGGDTLWVPFFSPDNPDEGLGFDNNYLADASTGTDAERQSHTAKYQGQAQNQEARGPNRECVPTPVLPMSSSKSALLTYIRAIKANGYTHIPLGLAWGWRVISPGEPFDQGHSYTDDGWDKVIIVLTDGDNRMPGDIDESNRGIASSFNHSGYTAYGFAREQRLGPGVDTADEMVDAIDESLGRVCDNVKAVTDKDGAPAITLYTITFGNSDTVISPGARDLMRDCATSDDHYFHAPSNERLKEIFAEIATELSKIRLTQ